ncbi:MAG: response regulator [Spirochaetales bacterium]
MSSLHSLLIVDDERVIREGLSSMFDWAGVGFQVTAVLDDGREALAHLEKRAVDAILTDIRMTFVSGLDLAREVREHYPDTRVVLLSGHREFELAQQAVAAGVHGYLLKPVDFSELRSVFSALSAELTREREERESIKREDERRTRERSFLLQQFYERVLTDCDLGRAGVDERYRRLGETQTLAGRPCAVVTASTTRRERQPLLPDAIGTLLAGDGRSIRYTPAMIGTREVEGRERRHFLAHANEPMTQEAFVDEVVGTARETVSGLTEMFGIVVEIAVAETFEDLYAATGYASSSGAKSHEQPARESEMLGAQSNRLIERAKHYLAEHYREPIGLTETALALGVSAPYLSRLFHAHASMKLIDYLTKLRIERAGELLAAGNQNVAEVAAAIGYASASHFSRVFKRLTGVPPADYRRYGASSAAQQRAPNEAD